MHETMYGIGRQTQNMGSLFLNLYGFKDRNRESLEQEREA
jgi:hypothetical protein